MTFTKSTHDGKACYKSSPFMITKDRGRWRLYIQNPAGSYINHDEFGFPNRREAEIEAIKFQENDFLGGKEMIEHCLIYCCLGGKSLYKNYLSGKGEFVLAAKRDVLPNAHVLNGTVCFSCDIGKVEKIKKTDDGMVTTGEVLFNTKTTDSITLRKRACLNHKQMSDYQPKHALYLTNVEAIAPMPITALGRRDPTHLNLAEGIASGMFRAPQNMCWAWAWNDEERKWERVLVLSIQSKNLANIANGLKDIETRRQVVNEIKEMEK